MTQSPLSHESQRIAECLAAYGADRRRWPLADQALGQTEDLDRVTEAVALDGYLHWPAPAADAELRRRLLSAAEAVQAAGRLGLWHWLGGWRLFGPSLACGLGVGLLLGLAPINNALETEAEVDVLATAMLASNYEDDLP